MKKDDIYSGIVVMIVALVLYGLSFGIHEDVVPGDTLGSRFFPRLTVLLLAACAVVIIRNGIKSRAGEASIAAPAPAKGISTPKRALWTVVLSFAYIPAFTSLGVLIATPLLLFGILMAWGERSKISLIVLPILSTALIYLAFVYAFDVNLPMGLLG